MQLSEIKDSCKDPDVIKQAVGNGICEQISRFFESEASAFIFGTGGEDDMGAEAAEMAWPATFVTSCLVLRNLCSCGENCEFFRERDIFEHLKTVIRRLSRLSSSRLGADEKRKGELKKIANYTVQTISNVAACGVAHVSQPLVDDLVRDMIALSSKHESRAALAASMAALYNSIVNPESAMRTRLESICSHRSLWCQLLLSSLGSVDDKRGHQDPDPAGEWFGYLIEKVIEFGLSNKVLTLVGPNQGSLWGMDDSSTGDSGEAESPKSSVTHEQIVLISMMLEFWDDGKYLNAVSPSSPEKCLWVEEDMKATIHALARLLRSVTSVLAVRDENSHTAAAAAAKFSEQDAIVQATLSYGALIALLDALAACLSWRYYQQISEGGTLRESLENDEGIIKSILSVLAYSSDITVSVFDRFELTADEKADLQRAGLRTLGNAVYRSKVVQDAFRHQDGFALVLPLCATNLEVPLAREWALLVMRNALEGNSENQEYITSLQPQGEAFVQDEVLKEANMGVVFDQATNKFRMKKMV